MAYLTQALNFDALPDDDKGGDMTPVPSGVYSVVVDGAELKTTKAGTGQYISLMLKIQGGEFNGRVIFDIINISNPNETAQRIGLSSLKNIMRSLGIQAVQDTDQLIGGRLVVKVGVELSQQYGDKNKVKAYQSAPAQQHARIGSISNATPEDMAPPRQPQPQPFTDDIPF